MDIKELKNKTAQELRELLETERVKLRELRFKASEGQLKTVRVIRATRQTIAQILTILNASQS